MSFQSRIDEYQENNRDQGEEELERDQGRESMERVSEGDEYEDEGDWVREEAEMERLYWTDRDHDLANGYDE